MTNDHLVRFLESSSLITKVQSGFRKTQSTNGHLLHFEAFDRGIFKWRICGESFLTSKKHMTPRNSFSKDDQTTLKEGMIA